MEWCREKEVEIAFVREARIRKNGRGIETYPSFILMSVVKNESTVMAYVRNGMEEKVEVVKAEDNHIIIAENNKKRVGGVYTNSRWHGERWKR